MDVCSLMAYSFDVRLVMTVGFAVVCCLSCLFIFACVRIRKALGQVRRTTFGSVVNAKAVLVHRSCCVCFWCLWFSFSRRHVGRVLSGLAVFVFARLHMENAIISDG